MRSLVLGLAALVALAGPAVPDCGAATSNENIAQQIAGNMKQSGRLKDYRVGVKYEDGVAWLMGTVTSDSQRRIAEEIASSSEGVDHVICKLEVTGNGTEEPVADRTVSYEQPQSASTPRAATSGQQPPRNNTPLPYARSMQGGEGVRPAGYQAQQAQYCPEGGYMGGGMGGPAPMGHVPGAAGASVNYDNPQMPGYAWPSYAASPNYAALTYPRQYSASAWPYIGPFYPYPQVPLGWRKVTLEWDDGWWFLDFKDGKHAR